MIWIRKLQHYCFSDLCFDFLHHSILFLPPDEFNSLFSESSAEVWAKVKKEKIDRSEFRAQLKADKYVNDKERIESLVVYDGEGKALVGKWVLLALFVISSEIFTPKSSDFVGSHTTQKHGTLEGPIGHNFHMSG